MQKIGLENPLDVEIDFSIENTKNKLRIFTTRPDTIFGATFIAVSKIMKFVKIYINLLISKNLKKSALKLEQQKRH